jgi:hypothetical protein
MGGGPSTQTTTSGFATEYKPEIKEMLGEAKRMYDSGELGKVADFSQAGKDALAAGKTAAGIQTGLEADIAAVAGQPLDLSGTRAAALQQAQGALGMATANAGARGGIGGSRNALDQASIAQGLAANFAGIDQKAQEMQMQNLNTALGVQGTGAATLGQVGQAEQAQNQALADAPYTALAQRIGLFSGVAPKEQVTEKTGGK